MFKEIHSYDLIKLNQTRSLIMIVKVVQLIKRNEELN